MVYYLTDCAAALKADTEAILPSHHLHNKAMATNNLHLQRDHTAVEDGSRLLKVKDSGLRHLEGQLMEGDQASLGLNCKSASL